MADDERLERLEKRVAVLEGLLRQLLQRQGQAPIETPVAPAPAPPPASVPPPRPSAPRPAPTVAPAGAKPARPTIPGPGRPEGELEQWVGGRLLLGIGVFAMLLAVGYLLKLSFDRGWIQPSVRCAGGALLGAGIGALGWSLERRGLRTYGSALLGCGAGIIYLAVWAAARLYALVPPYPAIIALAGVSLALAAIAWGIDHEALGATAALGALMAPIVVGRESGDVNVLLIYLLTMGLALGAVAASRCWRGAMLIVLIGYFGLGWPAAHGAAPLLAWIFAIAGGSGGLFAGFRAGWPETRFLGFLGGWALLEAASGNLPTGVLVPLGGLVLAAPTWWRAVAGAHFVPWRGSGKAVTLGDLGEALYFYLTPWLLAWAGTRAAPEYFHAHHALAAAIIGTGYLAVGLLPRRPEFATVGAVALAIAAVLQWSGLGAVHALIGLTAGYAVLELWQRRVDWGWYALASFLVAIAHLFQSDAPLRPPADPAFTGAWALTLWLVAAVGAALSAGGLRRAMDDLRGLPFGPAAGTISGALVLFGVTGEIRRFFLLRGTSGLAAELLVSGWWMAFAAALVLSGFARGLKPVRVAGLTVAGLAVGKVILFDLSSLDALYRVASVAGLGIVLLGVAYLYNRTSRGAGSAADSASRPGSGS